MSFKDEEKDTFSFDDLATEDDFKNEEEVEVKEKKGLFGRKKKDNSKSTNSATPIVTTKEDERMNNDDVRVSDGYFTKPDSIGDKSDQVDELDELFIATSSASAINDLVSKNNLDLDEDDEKRRNKLISEIENELNGNSNKTGAVKTINKPVKKAEVKKKKPINKPIDNSKEQLLAQRQMELDNIMKEMGIEEGTFNTKDEEIEEEKEVVKEEVVEETPTIPKKTNINRHPTSKKTKEISVNEFLTTKNIIILSVAVCLILVIALVVTLLLNKETKNNAVLTVKDKIIVKSPTNKYVMTFGDVNSRVSVENISLNNAYEYFTKIKVKIKNKKKSTANIRGTHEFVLIGVNNEKISTCLTSSDLTNYNSDDAIPSTIPAKTTVEGYLYCKSNITYLPKLQITSVREIDENAAQSGEIVGLSAYMYTVNLGA